VEGYAYPVAGLSEAVVIKHHDFVEGFWKGVEAIQGNESSRSERFDVKPLSFICVPSGIRFPSTGYNDLT